MTKETGGPAFPQLGADGLSVRDYFAAKAMRGINWRLVDYGGDTKETKDRRISAEQAAWCYAIADAMIAEREKDDN